MKLCVCAGLCFLICAMAQGEPANLALSQSGGMASALASAARMEFSAQKACDGKAMTGWVSEKGKLPVWFRIEWRVPVEIHEVVVRPFPDCPIREAGFVGEYMLEVRRGRKWVSAAQGDASETPLDEEIRHTFKKPAMTDGIRLRFQSAPTGQVAISEFQVLGPEVVLPVEWLPRWKAFWIWSEPSLYVPHREPVRRYLRRSFNLDAPGQIVEAWLLGCAFDRLNGMWVNGQLALKHGSFNGGSLRQARVAKLPLEWLRKGENVLAAEVDDIYESGSHGLLAELVLVHRDGTRKVIRTDDQWEGQEDQGKVNEWRQPGLSDKRWIPCRVRTWPNTRWHWLWNVPRPVVAPEDTLKLLELKIRPQPVKAGSTVQVKLAFECKRTPRRDYAVVVRLGQPSFWRNHDLELWGAYLHPEEIRTSRWKPGRHEVTLQVPVPDYAPTRTPATLMVSTQEGGAGLSSELPDTVGDPYGVHFTVQVDRGNRKKAAGSGFPRCEIRSLKGNPALTINGEAVPPILWSSSYGNYRRYSEYSKTGIKLFRPILQGTPICAPGEEEEFYPWWFAQVDKVLSAAVSIDPEVKLLPGVWMDPNPEWLFQRPSEQMLGGRGRLVIPLSYLVPDRGQVRPTFLSQAWRRDGGRALERLVKHLAAQPYAPNVIGLCFMAGRAGENYWGGNERNVFINKNGRYDVVPRSRWEIGDFSMAARRTFRDFLISKYKTDQALQKAWRQPNIHFDDVLEPARFDREQVCDALVWTAKSKDAGSLRDPLEPGVGTLPMDYFQCFSEAMLDTFAAWGRAAKEASGGRLITGCYYGYAIPQLYTSLPGFHGHTAVSRACRTPYLDFYVSPSEYNRARRAGGPYWGLNIIDSLRLHNKLWIYEQDSRTFLAEHAPKTYDRQETIEVFKRDAAAALTRGVGWWYYEFAQGQGGSRAREWFIDPSIAAFAQRIRKIYASALTLPHQGPSAEIAVFYHGKTLTAQDIFTPTPQVNITIGRLTLVDGMQRIGAPYDLYNLADLPLLKKKGLLRQYKMCLFLNPFYLTAEERSWLELCKGGGRTLVWLWAPGLSQDGKPPAPKNVAEVTGISGVKWLHRRAVQTYRLSRLRHPITAGLPPGREFTALPFPRGGTWERFGNEVWPLLYVDPKAAGRNTRALASWVLDGKMREDMAALSVKSFRGLGRRKWTSVYAAIPYLAPELVRNIARNAGVHIYREGNEVLFANRHFVAIHTARDPATGELHLPQKANVEEVFDDQVVGQNTDTIPLNIPPYSTRLYRLTPP